MEKHSIFLTSEETMLDSRLVGWTVFIGVLTIFGKLSSLFL